MRCPPPPPPGSNHTHHRPRRIGLPWRISLPMTVAVATALFFGAFPVSLFAANTAAESPPGFQGIPWGSALSDVAQLDLVERDDRVVMYAYRETPPRFARGPVESITLYAIDRRFARVMIRYHGARAHERITQAMEKQFGDIQRRRGSMVRGLNQEYFWRLEDTDIGLSYRELGERGLVMIQSRVFAPRFLELLSDHTH